MTVLPRFILGSVFLAAGIAAGIGLTAVLGGSAGDDACHGAGRVDRTIIGPAETGSKAFTVCSKLGMEVIFDPNGTPVSQTFREEEIIEYYKTHPADNPRAIADQTADAAFGEEGFVVVELPSIPAAPETCANSAVETTVDPAALALCLPNGWKLRQRAVDAVDVLGSGGILGVFPPDLRGTTANKCARPQIFEAAAGQIKLCALPVDPIGGQGHGFVLPSGREGGMSIYDVKDEETRNLLFNILYSIREIGQ